ncbi:basic-leucine zipper transcription factor [Mucor lusitanicus]
MSTSSSSTEPPQPPQSRFSFQHFDQECDFGIENADGERKPGRKPNPPTIQERRAQNRAAQKAFREREQQRREEKERQWRDYSEEIKSLKKQLASVQYEAKYLKACVLHLTLACLIHRGSVPHIWTESRIIPSNSHGEYKKPVYEPYGQHIVNEAYQTPALLDMVLENQCIVDFNKALFNTSQHNTDDSNDSTGARPTSFPRAKKQKLNPNRSPSPPPATPQTSLPSPPTKHARRERYSSSPTFSTLDDHANASHEEGINHPPQSNQVLAVNRKPVIGVLFEPPVLRTSEDIVNMPTLQALHILRLQLKLGSILGSMTPAALLPTALQRVIPHDIRIDYVPGASIRDRMIIFQDYYNMDDCFQFLTQNTVFMGGDVRDTRNWVIDPEYSLKFWFLSHQLVDQSYNECLDITTSDILHEELCKDDDSSSSEAEDMEATTISTSATLDYTTGVAHQQTTNIPLMSGSNNGVDLKQHQNVYFREM